MIHSLSIKDFNYDLPDSSVAKYPLPDRDRSKLLVWHKNVIVDRRFSDLPGLLPKGTMLIFNNTRVIHARLHFTKSTGANIEVFCLEPTEPNDYVLSFAQNASCRWKCMVGNLKRWKGERLELLVTIESEERGGEERPGDGERGRRKGGETERVGEGKIKGAEGRDVACNVCSLSEVFPEGSRGKTVVLSAEMLGKLEGGVEVNFSWDNSNYTFSEILEAAGNIPIPPYLHRESEEIDLTVYQTVYAKIKGSVAAPTAGLHFTERVFRELADRDISCEELTLHVGAGTFQPIKSDTIGDHRMHTEHFSVNKAMINRMIAHSGKMIAVGTTSVRTLESLFWIGCKIIQSPHIEPDKLLVAQWEPYQNNNLNIDAKESLRAISSWLSRKEALTLDAATQIMILPGYHFRIINGLITNFHQPQSTLLLLISAILGDDWKRVYAHALAEGYRFLSYGDANLYLM